jgi:hypothetical protein
MSSSCPRAGGTVSARPVLEPFKSVPLKQVTTITAIHICGRSLCAAVLNLSPTIAITENRVDDANREAVLHEMRSVDPTSDSGRRAAKMCRAETAKPT